MAQWTPQQLLSVASHAMQSNRVEDAINVYQYLARSFPGTTEADFAEREIGRLSAPAGEEPVAPAPLKPRTGRPQPRSASGRPIGNGHDPADASEARERRARRDRFPVEAVHPAAERSGFATREVTPYVRDYKTGTLLARMISGIGWIAFLLGGVLALVGATGLVMARLGLRLPQLPYLDLVVLSTPLLAGIAAAGLIAVVVGQSSRALFDQANATRELLEIRRRY